MRTGHGERASEQMRVDLTRILSSYRPFPPRTMVQKEMTKEMFMVGLRKDLLLASPSSLSQGISVGVVPGSPKDMSQRAGEPAGGGAGGGGGPGGGGGGGGGAADGGAAAGGGRAGRPGGGRRAAAA